MKFGIDIIANEIEKGRELVITDSFGVGFVAFGEAVQEIDTTAGKRYM